MPLPEDDLFVIGGGSGGVRAARVAARAGVRVALAEQDRYGGTCVIRGCVPKKLMVFASEFSALVDDACAYGWQFEAAGFDWSRFRGSLHADCGTARHPRTANLRRADRSRGARGRGE